MDVELYKRRIANRLEAVNLSGLDDKDVSSGAFKRLAVDRPHAAAFTDELDLIIRMPMRTRSGTWFPMKQKNRNSSVCLLRSDKLV